MNIRNAIKVLQVFPIIISVAFIADILLDAIGVYITPVVELLFGVSVLPLCVLYYMARQLKVQRWSRILYVTLLLVVAVDALDMLTGFSLTAVWFNRLMFAITSVGTISSFITYIYSKYKHGNI